MAAEAKRRHSNDEAYLLIIVIIVSVLFFISLDLPSERAAKPQLSASNLATEVSSLPAPAVQINSPHELPLLRTSLFGS